MTEYESQPRILTAVWRTLAVATSGALLAVALIALQQHGARSASHAAAGTSQGTVRQLPTAPPGPASAPAVFVTPEAAKTILIVSTDTQAATVRQAWEEAEAARSQLDGTPPANVVILVVPEALTSGAGGVFQSGYIGAGTTVVDLRGR